MGFEHGLQLVLGSEFPLAPEIETEPGFKFELETELQCAYKLGLEAEVQFESELGVEFEIDVRVGLGVAVVIGRDRSRDRGFRGQHPHRGPGPR